MILTGGFNVNGSWFESPTGVTDRQTAHTAQRPQIFESFFKVGKMNQ